MDCALTLPVSSDLRDDLLWWLDEDNLLMGQPIQDLPPDHLLFTDASQLGWGAHLRDLEAQGLWSQEEKLWHINALELKAVFLGLKHFLPVIQGTTVVAMTDNTTVVGYVKNQGGTRSRQLTQLTTEMLSWSQQQGITLQSRHIPGQRNVRADQLSRAGVLLPAEWSLHPGVCKALWKLWGQPHVDLFATSRNSRLQLYFSPFQDDQALGTDALSQDWDGMTAYAYPPSSLIPLVLRKVEDSRDLDLILVVPAWPTKPWFPQLLELLVDRPVKLPALQKLLRQEGQFHSNILLLNLHAWRLSSVPGLRQAFLQKQSSAWQEQSGPPPRNCTSPSGVCSRLGAVEGRSIHLQHLSL